jgi:(R,R)-butanediol dehydrogenase/meso-butanediol dehydrogenase/diacetyl reductase
MRAARLYGLGDVRVEEVPVPPDPGPGEAVVAPLWAGLCGTDLKEFAGPGAGLPTTPHRVSGACLPLTLGHEFSARVVATGPGIDHVSAGDEVAVMPLQYCGHCHACRRGQFVLCPDKVWTGLTSYWGGLGDLVLVHSYQLTPLNGIPAAAGALIEPAAVALNAAVRARIAPGDIVLVTGAGAIGVFAIMSAQLSGAAQIIATETNPHRVRLAADLGAEVVAPGELKEFLASAPGSPGVDVALECAGKPAALAACVQSVRPGGTVGVPAVHPHGTDTDIRRITREQLTVIGSIGYSQDAWERTTELVRAGLMPVERAVTARIDRDDVAERGFAALAAQPSQELKVLVRVND